MPLTVADIGEAGVIARIGELVSGTWSQSTDVHIGIGDDAAVLNVGGSCVIATDALVEGVHFRRDWVDAQSTGRKLAARNFADIVAMGARPRALLLALVMPADTHVEWLDGFLTGLVAETQRAGAQLIGGDTSAGGSIAAVATAIGEAGSRAVTRAGAGAGDVVAVSGEYGAAAAGLAILNAGRVEPSAAIAAYASPSPNYQLALRAAADASSMIDCSDGLVNDLGHLARASGCDLRITSARVPCATAATLAGVELSRAVDDWVLTGGEDHGFLATFPSLGQVPDGFTVIGEVVAGDGLVWVDDQPWQGVSGYQHFAHANPDARS